MSTCAPAENSWIRQQPWKPLALGALASIPAYLAMRALKYSPLASLATSALTFSAVTLTTGLLGKTKIEIEPPNTPPPPPLSWTGRVKANLERQGMPQEVLDLVTEHPDLDALALAILKARTGQEGYASDSYVNLLDSAFLPIYTKIPGWEFQLQRDDLETLDLETCLGQWEQIEIGDTTYWTNEAQTYRDFFTQTSDAARLRQSLLNLGIRSFEMKDEPLDAAQLSPKIAQAFDGDPYPRDYEIWVDDKRFPACTARDYSQVLFTEDQLNNLDAVTIQTALDALNQEEVEVDGQTLYLEPGVTLPAGDPALVDPRWKSWLKDRVRDELHPVIDQQRGTLDDISVRKALSAAIIGAYLGTGQPESLYIEIDGLVYEGYNSALPFAKAKHVFSKRQLELFDEKRHLQALIAGRAHVLEVEGVPIFLDPGQLTRIFARFADLRMHRIPPTGTLSYDPQDQLLSYTPIFTEGAVGPYDWQGGSYKVKSLKLHQDTAQLSGDQRKAIKKRAQVRQALEGVGIDISPGSQLDRLFRHEQFERLRADAVSEAIFCAYRGVKNAGELPACTRLCWEHNSGRVPADYFRGHKESKDCVPEWTLKELRGLTKEMLDNPGGVKVTVEGFGNNNTEFHLGTNDARKLLVLMGLGNHKDLDTLHIQKITGGKCDEYRVTGSNLDVTTDLSRCAPDRQLILHDIGE